MKTSILIAACALIGCLSKGSEMYFTLGVNKQGDGLVSLNNTALSQEKIDLVLQRLVDLDPDMRLLIIVEPEVSVGFTALFMNKLYMKGIKNFKVMVFTELPEGSDGFEAKVDVVINNTEDVPELMEFNLGEPKGW